MYNYQVDEDEINKKLKEVSSLDELKDAYKQIDKDNGFDFGEVGGYQKEEREFNKVDVPDFSKEQIEKEANNFYKDEIETKKDDLDKKYSDKQEDLLESKENAFLNQEKNEQKIETDYNNKSKQSLYNSIKQGIARSSIENGKQEKLINQKNTALENLKNETNLKLEKIENSLAILNQEKEKAMMDFDLAYAVKIKDKINKLEAEYNKQKEEAIKYNQKIEEDERKFNEEQQKKSEAYDKEVIRKMEEHENNLKTLGVFKVYGEEIINEKQELALNFLNSIPKQEAVDICLSDIFVKNLGAKRAYDLYRLMIAREN